ncbi:MAG TPA: hypothetical protein VF260_04515 [Bacilli bacterium]
MQTQIQAIQDVAIAKQLFAEVFQGEKINKIQLFFLSDVLKRYRENDGYKIIRTDTSGRLSKIGGWSLDFGISGENDSFIHAAAETVVGRIPKSEHDHWLSYLVSLPVSANYIKGLVRPGCLDDGPIRTW